MDLDGDGLLDVISGSWPGEIYWFRRKGNETFAAAAALTGPGGKPLNVGSASAAFAADWSGDGRLDLVVGTLLGEVFLIPGAGATEKPAFGEPQPMHAGGKPIRIESGDAAPIAVDWDGDGDLDLLVGGQDGSVVWYENVGGGQLAEARVLVEPKPDDQPGRPGRFAKICATDWNGNGRLDLLLGDLSRGQRGRERAEQSDREAAEEAAATDELADLRTAWADTFQQYRQVLAAADAAEREHELEALRTRLKRYKDEIAAAQRILEYHAPRWQWHGRIWLFPRNGQSGGR